MDLRVEAVQQPAKMPQALVDSEAIHDRLWSMIAALSKQNSDSVVLGLYIQSLNEVIDLHSKRVTVGLQYQHAGSTAIVSAASTAGKKPCRYETRLDTSQLMATIQPMLVQLTFDVAPETTNS